MLIPLSPFFRLQTCSCTNTKRTTTTNQHTNTTSHQRINATTQHRTNTTSHQRNSATTQHHTTPTQHHINATTQQHYNPKHDITTTLKTTPQHNNNNNNNNNTTTTTQLINPNIQLRASRCTLHAAHHTLHTTRSLQTAHCPHPISYCTPHTVGSLCFEIWTAAARGHWIRKTVSAVPTQDR
jgi:hypothetical protein